MTTLSPRLLVLDGDLDLTGENADPSGLTFRIDTLGAGTSWGNPEGITRLVSSWLADGSIVTHDRDDNRTLTIPVRVTAATSAALQAGESALFHRCNRPTTVAWTPPWDDDAPVASIFEVWSGSLEGDLQSNGGDLNELRLTRYYTLTLTAKPYTRSQALVEFAALTKPTTPDSVLIDACNSTTGWTGSPNAAGTTGATVTETITTEVSSRLGGGRQAGGATYHLSLTRAGSVDMTGYPYLQVAFSMPGVSWEPKVYADGVLLTQVAASKHVRWFKAPASFTTLKVGGSFYTNRKMTVMLSVFDVTKSNVAGAVYTGHELARTLWVEGSARTAGALAVEHETDALGEVVVYTAPASPAGYVPAMSGYWSDGPTRSADSTAVSGSRSLIDFSTVEAGGAVLPTFTIPGNQVIEGDYGVMARFKTTTPGTYDIGIRASTAGHFLASESAITTTAVTTDDDTYDLFWLGRVTLPPLAIPATSDTDVVVTIVASDAANAFAATDPIYLDELWLFNLTDGAVTIVNAGTAQRVWLDSADGERANPTIWLGSDPDRTDAVAAPLLGTVQAMGSHQLIPGYMDLFTVTTGAVDADASVSYYPRWHTHAVL